MKSIIALNFLFISFFITSCGNKSVDDGYYFQNFDDIRLWTGDQNNLVNNISHSGEWSSKMDASHEYSQTFSIDMKRVEEKGYTKVKVTAWGYIAETNNKTALIVTVDAPDKNINYSSAPFEEFINGPKTWGKVTARLNLPDLKGKQAVLKVYAWASNKKESYLDDVEIQFEK